MAVITGLTGQTGAGKSTASEFAAELGCAVINADMVAREALAAGSECLLSVAEHFGRDIILPDGECNRPLLASRAFSSEENTKKLNSITHPWIIDRVREYIEQYVRQGRKCIVFDAPQLFESGGDALCNFVIAVTAPKDIRLQRIMSRDGITRQQAEQRMSAQKNDDYYTKRAGYVIDGCQERSEVRKRIKEILKAEGCL